MFLLVFCLFSLFKVECYAGKPSRVTTWSGKTKKNDKSQVKMVDFEKKSILGNFF